MDPNTKKIAIIIQARMNSSRLPGKIMMEWGEGTMLERIVQRVRTSNLSDAIIVATTDTAVDDPVEALCKSMMVDCYRGSEHLVIKRIIGAAQKCRADIVVRLTADNPFVDGSLVDLCLDQFMALYPNIDYAANIDNCGFPFGLFVEIVKLNTLMSIMNDANAEEAEHVTLHIRKHKGRFTTRNIFAKQRFPEINLSVDTIEDRVRLLSVFNTLYEKNPNFSLNDIANIEFN
ncbi:NTP transferase domain-containing protein [Alphaproteobacteria bacterium]|nr:NTP transferase domain-containing protein [Alphaproteobacteria bacterium]